MASTEDLATTTRFAAANEADFPLLSDPDAKTAKAYGVLTAGGYPARWTYYIDAQGKIAHIDKLVSPLSAGEDIATRLDALGVQADR